ncbi:MAG: hypothetical protein OHK0029_00760 [Armatimonadaceae bacterium]
MLESRAGESNRHIVLKILAYLIFRDKVFPLPLEIERGVGQRHKPDLVALDSLTGGIRLWVDCGQIQVIRLGRIVEKNPAAPIRIIKATMREAELYSEAASKGAGIEPNPKWDVKIIGFEDGFIEKLESELRGANSVKFSRNAREQKEFINILWNETPLESALFSFTPFDNPETP